MFVPNGKEVVLWTPPAQTSVLGFPAVVDFPGLLCQKMFPVALTKERVPLLVTQNAAV